jgi:DNA repair ATPase RecN
MVSALEDVVRRTDATVSVTSTTINEAVRETGALEKEEDEVSATLTGLRQRLTEMSRVRQGASGYVDALKIQRKRLKITDWLLDQTTDSAPCVLCGDDRQPADDRLGELAQSLKQIESSIGDFDEIPAAFDRELQRVQSDVSETTEKLKAIRTRREALLLIAISAPSLASARAMALPIPRAAPVANARRPSSLFIAAPSTFPRVL